MAFHIVLPRRMNLREQARKAELRLSPRHAIGLLVDDLAATVHEPDDLPTSLSDKLRAKIVPTENLWSLARRVRSVTNSDDVVLCSSEAGGLQLAAVCEGDRNPPRIAMFVHNVDRARARLALRLWHMRSTVELFLACANTQVDFLRGYLRLPPDRVRHIIDHTDTQFFSPGPSTTDKRRPLIVSVGLEQRDYVTLAEATAELDVDVKISGFSKDANVLSETFPLSLPKNMTRRFYEWPELVELYRSADVVVVSCRENRYAAGVQSLMEATACRRPVIATATQGLQSYIDDSIVAVEPGNIHCMKEAILQDLQDPVAAAARADRAYQAASRRYAMERFNMEVSQAIRSLATTSARSLDRKYE
jgi:glycosyltransferase involved in cell wall biosynthesis